MASLQPHRFLWDEDAVRELFQNKLWPEYVGNETRVWRYYFDRDVKATLPVILWEEQIPTYDNILQLKASKKRKLDNTDTTIDDLIPSSSSSSSSSSESQMNTNFNLTNDNDSIRKQIFHELHTKGYFVGPGDIYGMLTII